jgi:hypothetical protein
VHTLIYQLTAAGTLRLRPPFTRIPRTASVAITSAQVHEGSENSRVENSPRLLKGAVIAMIETDAHAHPVLRRELRQAGELLRVACCRFLHQHVLTGGDCVSHDVRLDVRWSGDDDRIDIGSGEWLAPVRAARTFAANGGHLRGALWIEVHAVSETDPGQVLRAFSAHRTAADESDVHWLPPKSSCRSPGTIRRSV